MFKLLSHDYLFDVVFALIFQFQDIKMKYIDLGRLNDIVIRWDVNKTSICYIKLFKSTFLYQFSVLFFIIYHYTVNASVRSVMLEKRA